MTSFAREARFDGVRGGKNEFNWESVKKMDRDRDSYLGACLKASVRGRRDVDRDWFWYNKSTDTLGRALGADAQLAQARRRLEILERKQADDAGLADALGETSESRKRADAVELEVSELRALLERGGTERDRLDTERVAGLGAAPVKRHEHVKSAKVSAEIERQEKSRRERELLAADAARRSCRELGTAPAEAMNDGGFVRDSASHRSQADATASAIVSAADVSERTSRKRARKEAKKEKKDVKKAKKALKKETKKEEKREEKKRARRPDRPENDA